MSSPPVGRTRTRERGRERGGLVSLPPGGIVIKPGVQSDLMREIAETEKLLSRSAECVPMARGRDNDRKEVLGEEREVRSDPPEDLALLLSAASSDVDSVVVRYRSNATMDERAKMEEVFQKFVSTMEAADTIEPPRALKEHSTSRPGICRRWSLGDHAETLRTRGRASSAPPCPTAIPSALVVAQTRGWDGCLVTLKGLLHVQFQRDLADHVAAVQRLWACVHDDPIFDGVWDPKWLATGCSSADPAVDLGACSSPFVVLHLLTFFGEHHRDKFRKIVAFQSDIYDAATANGTGVMHHDSPFLPVFRAAIALTDKLVDVLQMRERVLLLSPLVTELLMYIKDDEDVAEIFCHLFVYLDRIWRYHGLRWGEFDSTLEGVFVRLAHVLPLRENEELRSLPQHRSMSLFAARLHDPTLRVDHGGGRGHALGDAHNQKMDKSCALM